MFGVGFPNLPQMVWLARSRSLGPRGPLASPRSLSPRGLLRSRSVGLTAFAVRESFSQLPKLLKSRQLKSHCGDMR
jgi:hypothetical protein